jgi:hypothetical protein
MKRTFTLLTTTMLIMTLCVVGCSKYDDTEVWGSINSLKERVSAMETVMNAYKNNLYITSVATAANGYVITFSDGSKAVIEHGIDGKDGEKGETGQAGEKGEKGDTGQAGEKGLDGIDGDTYIKSITIGEDEVTFILDDDKQSSFSIALYSALSIAFDVNDLVAMGTSSTRDIHYTIKSMLTDVKIEAISSADMKAKIVPDGTSNLTGVIRVTTGATIDEYSKVVVLVSNGEKVVMRSLAFEVAGVQVAENVTSSATAEGGVVELGFLSNVECEAVIPEAAQSWISVVPATRALTYNAITLKLEPNTGYNRSAVIKVQSADGSVSVDYTVEQEGNLGENDGYAVPADEIWYVTANEEVYDVNREIQQPFDKTILSNTYKDGKGIIKFSGAVTRIGGTDYTGNLFFGDNLIELYLPDNIEHIGAGAIIFTGLTTLRIPHNLKTIGLYGLHHNSKIESYTGSHVSEDGKCVIIDKIMYAFAPKGTKAYTIPTEVKTVAKYAFAGSNDLEAIVFPEGMVTIREGAVSECPLLRYITLSSTIETIMPYAFRENPNLEGFYGNEKYHTSDNKCLIVDGWLCGFAGKGITEYVLPEGIRAIENYAFSAGRELTHITIPNTLAIVGGHREVISENIASGASYSPGGSYAFSGCENLEAVYGPNTSSDHLCIIFKDRFSCLAVKKGIPANYAIPENITSVGYEAFVECQGIENITMGDQVTDLGGYAFSDCPNLKSVTLSAGIKKVGWNPFKYSTNLESIYCRAVIPPSYNDTQMSDFPKLKFYVPEQSLELYKNHPSWGVFAKYMVGYKYEDLPEINNDYYISTDFSQDGKVTTLQTAKEGKGIDIILMGDGYSDRQIADGTYDDVMELAAEKLFTEEPYKSFRDYFNVYAVKAVSYTEGYEHDNTIFGGYFGEGSYVNGNHQTVFTYAQKAINEERMDEALMVVMMNSDAYAGTCHMYYPTAGNYGNGTAIAFFPVGIDEMALEQVLHHEANGHGFAKLADEYAYEGQISASDIAPLKEQEQWGWNKNVDFTSDPGTIKWSHFLADSRYAGDGLGAFEGGATFSIGVWRPTDNSIMRYNTGGFNAPSREAIYYRMHKLAYGSVWAYNYEEFVAYDAINRKTAAAAKGVPYRMSAPKNFKPLHPPVVKKMSWREAK